MPIVVYCKACAKKIRVPDGPPGRTGKCPQCQADVAIPEKDEPPPTPHSPTSTPASHTSHTSHSSHSGDRSEAPTPREALEPVSAPKKVRIAVDFSKANKSDPDTTTSGRIAPKPELIEKQGKIHWDTSPDPAPSRAPWYLALAAIALAGGGYGLWYFMWGKPDPRATPEERKREQFQVPESTDEIRRRFAPAGKTGATPEKSKSLPPTNELKPETQ